MVSLLLTILSAYIVYKCFEKGGFKLGYIFVFVWNTIEMIIDNGVGYILFILAFNAIFALITTGFDYLIYKKTNSFISYFIISIIVGLIISVLLTLLVLPLFI